MVTFCWLDNSPSTDFGVKTICPKIVGQVQFLIVEEIISKVGGKIGCEMLSNKLLFFKKILRIKQTSPTNCFFNFAVRWRIN